MKVLVVGGSGGIGKALVETLRKDGHDVCFTFAKNEARASEIEKSTGAKKIRYDHASEASEKALLDELKTGGYDGLVHAAAEPYSRTPLLKTDSAALLGYANRHFRSAFEISRAFAEAAKENKTGGAIVNVLSSVVLGLPPEKQSSYVTLKYMMLALTRCQAVEYRAYGIRVNAVSPGMTRTDFIADLPERFVQVYEEGLPLGRIAEAGEVAAAIAFLLSPRAAYIHAANLPVTGGAAC